MTGPCVPVNIDCYNVNKDNNNDDNVDDDYDDDDDDDDDNDNNTIIMMPLPLLAKYTVVIHGGFDSTNVRYTANALN